MLWTTSLVTAGGREWGKLEEGIQGVNDDGRETTRDSNTVLTREKERKKSDVKAFPNSRSHYQVKAIHSPFLSWHLPRDQTQAHPVLAHTRSDQSPGNPSCNPVKEGAPLSWSEWGRRGPTALLKGQMLQSG